MGLAELVAWAMFAVLIGWLGFVLLATFRQLDGEAKAKREQDERADGV
jgi:hypothetical protein